MQARTMAGTRTLRHGVNRLSVWGVAVIGAVVMALSCYSLSAVWLLAGLPALFFMQPNRKLALTVIVTFYGLLNAEEYGDILHFFGMNPVFSLGIWLIHLALFVGVWMLFYKSHLSTKEAFWRTVIFTVLLLVPPLGVFVWTQPIIASGALFPGLKWMGLVLTIVLMGSLTATAKDKESCLLRLILIGLTTIALLCNIHYRPTPPPTKAIAINTDFGFMSPDVFKQLQNQETLVAKVNQAIINGNKIILLPENMTQWLPGTQMLWQRTSSLAKQYDASVFIGRVQNLKNGTFNSGFEVLGGSLPYFESERVPMPLGEWRPSFMGGSYHSHLLNSGVVKTANGKIAYIVCYEQMIPYPILLSFLHRPSLIISGANQWFANKMSYRKQQISLVSLARLFNTPTLVSTNW